MRGLRRPGRRTLGAGLTAVAFAGGAVLGAGLSPEPFVGSRALAESSATPGDLPAAVVAATSGETPRVVPTSPVHLLVPSVGLDLPLLAHTPRRGVIDPPTLTAGYWIEPYGVPAADPAAVDNTVYVAAHSAGRGSDGFDPLLSTDRRDSAVSAGDLVQVSTPGGTADYTVERTARYDKDDLPDAVEVWEAVPGRLVLITCFQRAGARAATENLVVFAAAS